MKEIWKTPKSLHKPWFEVSNLGNCRIKQHVEEFIRLGKKCSRLSGSRKKRYTIDPRGRRQVLVSSQRNNKQYLAFVHRLVAECFVKNDNPSKNTMVFFKDNDFSNCRADNLFWADIKEKGLRMKCIHSIKVGIFYTRDKNEKPIKIFESGNAAGLFLGVSKQSVNRSLKHNGMCGGFFIRRIDSTNNEHITSKRDVSEIKYNFPNELYK